MPSRCSSPRSVSVSGYWRAGPRKKAKPRQAPAKYWTCVNERTGQTCGVHHATMTSAVRHRTQLDRKSARAGRGRPWQAVHRGGK